MMETAYPIITFDELNLMAAMAWNIFNDMWALNLAGYVGNDSVSYICDQGNWMTLHCGPDCHLVAVVFDPLVHLRWLNRGGRQPWRFA